MSAFNIRATHQYGFRSGEWAEVVGVEWANGRPCFVVRFIDGTPDVWPIYDPSDPYEFRRTTTWKTRPTQGTTTDERRNIEGE